MKHIIQKILLSSIRQNIGILIKILDNIAIDNLPLKNSITMEKREGKVLWVQINSSIFTFLAAETTFRHINNVVRKSRTGIDRIVVTPLETEDRNITRPVFLSWVVNTNDRRCKVIHERHFTSYCKYLWWDIYVGKILGKLNRRKKRSLKRIFTDQSVQNGFIMESLMKLQNTRHFIDKDADVEDVFTQIREEWELRYARKGLGHAIMYRWQALKIGTELGLLELDRIIIKDICGRGRISPQSLCENHGRIRTAGKGDHQFQDPQDGYCHEASHADVHHPPDDTPFPAGNRQNHGWPGSHDGHQWPSEGH